MQELKQELQQIFKDANVVKWIGGLKVIGINKVTFNQLNSLTQIAETNDLIEDVKTKRSGTGITIIIDTF